MSPASVRRARSAPRVGLFASAVLGLVVVAPGLGLALEQGTELLSLPESTAEVFPRLRCHLVVDRESVAVDGVRVLRLETAQDADGRPVLVVPDDDTRGMLITALYDRLLEKFEDEKLGASAREALAVLAQRPELVREGELLLSIDRDTPFSVVRQVLYTAGQAQFGTFLFVTHNPWQDELRTIESALPRIGPPRQIDPEEVPPLMLSVLVGDRGLGLMGADDVLNPDGAPETDEAGPTVPCVSGGPCVGVDDYDWAELSRQLALIKAEHPDDLRVIVVAEPEVPYEVVVRVLDHARWAPRIPMDAEQGAWESWRSVREELFPFSILAGGAR